MYPRAKLPGPVALLPPFFLVFLFSLLFFFSASARRAPPVGRLPFIHPSLRCRSCVRRLSSFSDCICLCLRLAHPPSHPPCHHRKNQLHAHGTTKVAPTPARSRATRASCRAHTPRRGDCTYFTDGSFSSGASTCPQGVPQSDDFIQQQVADTNGGQKSSSSSGGSSSTSSSSSSQGGSSSSSSSSSGSNSSQKSQTVNKNGNQLRERRRRRERSHGHRAR
ncbi:hypothetical protein B0H14DRAFT_80344 [Mycena olivaceomarginata]|nr:hypothetical protein B0H14DRAFT_80344 [Mycena olivaceomarginata]